jgi:predicted chitinase
MGDESNPGSGVVGTNASGGTLLKVGTTYDAGNLQGDATGQKPKGPSECPGPGLPGLPNIPLKALQPKFDDSGPKGNSPKTGGVDTTGTPPPPGNQPPLKGGTDTTGNPNGNTPNNGNLTPRNPTPDNSGGPGGKPLQGGTDKNNIPLTPQVPMTDTPPPPPKKKNKRLKGKVEKDPCKKLGPVTNNNDNVVPLTADILLNYLRKSSGIPYLNTKLDLNQLAQTLNETMRLANITNRRRETAFLSQVVKETNYFQTLTEYGKGKGHKYGNYYGRGLVQLTWKGTYAAASKDLYGDDRLVKNPDLIVEDPEVDAQVTAWYWRNHANFNEMADAGNIDGVIYRLYGGTITSRYASVRRSVIERRCYDTVAKAVLNAASTP